MASQNLRIGIIGAGWVVRNRHLPALKKTEDVEVPLIWSRNPGRAKEVASEFGIPHVADRWQDVAQSSKVDAVIVATPPVLHLPATVAALDAGKHVLCQARMARNLSEAQQMVHAAEAHSLVTALYPPRPGLKGDRVVKRLLHDEKFVGEIREVRVTGMELAEQEGGYEWSVDPDVMGVNAMNLGLWVEVLNRWVGPAVRVLALGKCHQRQRRGPDGSLLEASIPDSLAIVAELKCGATASYHYATRAGLGAGNSIEIYGSRGTLIYRLIVEELLGISEGSEALHPIPIPPEEERFHSTDAEFVRAIREGTPVSPTFEEGLRYMEFCEAVALSLKTDSAVLVPPSRPAMQCWGRLLSEDSGSIV